MKKVLIVQARMTSTRLPGKILKDVAGLPMLAQQLRRLMRCEQIDEIVLATTANAIDQPVEDLGVSEGISVFRGSEHDVLSRYVGAAEAARADVVIRSTADSPLIDSAVVDRVVLDLLSHASECDYSSNVTVRTYPRGLDVEAFFVDVLRRMDRLATSATAREHVTTFLRSERPELFATRSVTDPEDNSDLRWTVDTGEDLSFVRHVYEQLTLTEKYVPYRDVVRWVRDHPEVIAINASVMQKNIYR